MDDEEKRKIPVKALLSAAIILVIIAASAGVYGYVYTQRPDLYKQALNQLQDVGMGIGSPDPAEIQRVSNINKLTISYEEKQILINKTIFLGATPRMVMMALGKPKEGHRSKDAVTGEEVIILVYHLPEELRPTMLHFKQGKLVDARKGSSVDFDTPPVPYTDIIQE